MRRYLRTIFLVFSFLAAFALDALAVTSIPVSSKGLYGCVVTSLASKSDGSLQMVTCDRTPKGFYYSVDFGQNWLFASGGELSDGRGYYVGMNDTYAFVKVVNMPTPGTYGERFYRALLPSASSPSWTPNWQQALTTAFPTASSITIRVSGNYIYGIDQSGNVTVVNAGTEAVTGTSTLPHSMTAFNQLVVANGSLYVSSLKKASGTPVGYLYKATINGDGAISAFSELTLPSSVYPYNVFVAPNGNIFFASGYFTDENNVTTGATYISTDGGLNFTQLTSGAAFGACFGGNSYFVGNKASRDGGTTWFTLSSGVSASGTVYFYNHNCLVNPASQNQALLMTYRGLARTTEFVSNTNPTWSDANKALEGVNVYEIAQALGDKDRMVLATYSGLFSTLNFTNTTPTWTSMCFDTDNCFGAGHVASDATQFYAAPTFPTKIYKGTITSTGDTPEIGWSELTAASSYGVQQIATYTSIPNTLLAARAGIASNVWGGGLYFYNLADGSASKVGLEGKAVRRFIALNQNLMFAAIGAYAVQNLPEDNGMYKTTDGGTTWNKITDTDFVKQNFTRFAYDSSSDTLYAVGINNSNLSTYVYYLDSATKGGTNWKTCSADFDRGLSAPSTLNIDDISINDTNGKIYLAGEGEIHTSTDKCLTWVKIVDEGPNSSINTLFFDKLLEGRDAGLYEVQEPSCTLRAIGYKGKAVALPKEFTLRLTYSGTRKNASLQTKASASIRRWKSSDTFRVRKGKATVVKVITKGLSVRGHFGDCVTNAVTFKKKR